MTKRLFFHRFRILLGSDRGNSSLLGVVLATALGTILIAKTVPFWLETQHRALMDQTTAGLIRQVSDGLAGYTKAYSGAIEGVATATKPAVIPLSALIATGFLPSGTNSLDPYGQTIVGEILQPNPGILVGAVVTQGGTPPVGSHLNQLATLIGAQGGFVPTADILSLPGICGTNCYQGSGGTWKATFSQYPFTGVGPGSLIALQSYNANNLPQDFLYRSNVPGFPQANQMQTNINMNGNNLNNAGTVNTYNLTSPNGTISTQAINTNGQPIYSGNLSTNAVPVGYEGGFLVYWTGLTVGGTHLCYLWGASAPGNTFTEGARLGEVFPSGVGWAWTNSGWIQPTC
ncbi:MAG: shufflon system plasmid conjugative transfer pilus tip adhesin PilV [Nitrospirota bacterium]|nr:shufflon system plasmid conjugative transfer pilus tip adhesin PilV [Nitrospirota bacterium]